jgi:putative FmdB family regulatory protein
VPTYSYACTACAHRFDTVQAFTDPSLTECPQCAGKLRKLFAPVGVVFKGSGFYRTDSRSSGKPKSESADKPSEGKPSEGKPAEGKPAEGKPGSGSTAKSDRAASGGAASSSTATSASATAR